MQVKNVSALVNRHEGHSVIILGSAPTLSFAASHSTPLGIFVGDAMLRTKLRPPERYFVRANSEYPNLTRSTHLSDLVQLDASWIIAETVMESSTPVRELLKAVIPQGKEGFVFDQRHFGGSPCSVPGECCLILHLQGRDRLTLQELLASYSETDATYSSGSTVSLHALALAVIMGCKEIHVAGVEIPKHAMGYTYAPVEETFSASLRRKIDEGIYKVKRLLTQKKLRQIFFTGFKVLTSSIERHSRMNYPSIFSPDFDQIIDDFCTVVKSANKVGARVFVCSHTSALLEIDGVSKCPLIPADPAK